MSLAFNKISFNIGLLDEAKRAKDEDLLGYHAEKIQLIADALNTERFSENYPKSELQDCLDLREEVNCVKVEQTDEVLYGKVWDKYIVPTGRRLARFTMQEEELISLRKIDERRAWQKLVDTLAGWERTPHMPNVYAELIPEE